MKPETFKNQAAQGDLLLRRVDRIPVGVKPGQSEDGEYIVAHSETGHNHVIEATKNVAFYTTNDPMISYLEVIEATDKTEVLLKHLRTFDTHKTIVVPPGIYEVRRQREYVPEGWRQITD